MTKGYLFAFMLMAMQLLGQENTAKSIAKHDNAPVKKLSKADTLHKEKNFLICLRPGLKYIHLHNDGLVSNRFDAEFPKGFGMRFGMQAKYVLPFMGKRLAISIEPVFQSYDATGMTPTGRSVFLTYKSIELPLGLSFQALKLKQAKLHMNAGLNLNFDVHANLNYINGELLGINASPNAYVGLALTLPARISVELRYQNVRNLLKDSNLVRSNYGSYSFILGYQINQRNPNIEKVNFFE